MPRINTGAAPWILSRVSACCLGFCLVFQSGALDQYWCGASNFVLGFGLAPQINTGAAPRILSCAPVWHLGFCLVFQFGTSDLYWCGALDSVSCSGLAPRINTGLAPRILSCVLVWHRGSILVHHLELILMQRLGFCLVFQFGTSDRYWSGALDSVSDSGLAPWILSQILVWHVGSILVRRLWVKLPV